MSSATARLTATMIPVVSSVTASCKVAFCLDEQSKAAVRSKCASYPDLWPILSLVFACSIEAADALEAFASEVSNPQLELSSQS